MVLPAKVEQIQRALEILRDCNVPLMVMGNGSNLLVKDKEFAGRLLK